jgi:hypothetical protein
MTGRRRSSDSPSTGSHTTTPHRQPSGGDTDATTHRPGGGGGVGANLDAMDTMSTRLDATRSRVDNVGNTVRNINVGPKSMGVLGSAFAGEAQAHLRTAEQHVDRTTQAVEQARTGTQSTVRAYRDTDATNAASLSRVDTTTKPPSTNPQAAATRTPSASIPTPPPGIMDRLNPPDASTRPTGAGRYQPSARELELRNRQVVGHRPLTAGPDHVNEAFIHDFADGSSGVYKPVSGEDPSLRTSIPGGLGDREVAAYRVDEALGFDRVPTTTMTDGHRGPGSLQEYAQGASEGLDAKAYPKAQQEQMAVLDYVTGNTDRHGGNYLTGSDGSVVAIDHGYSFPEGKDPYGIRSDFVADHLNQPLSPEVMAKVRAVDPDQFRGMLHDSGLSDAAVDGAMARFVEIRDRGMITGEAWPGRIHTGGMGRVRDSIA